MDKKLDKLVEEYKLKMLLASLPGAKNVDPQLRILKDICHVMVELLDGKHFWVLYGFMLKEKERRESLKTSEGWHR